MKNHQENFSKNNFDYPNRFWKYYDLYRRGTITLMDFQRDSNLSLEEILECLHQLENERCQSEHFVL